LLSPGRCVPVFSALSLHDALPILSPDAPPLLLAALRSFVYWFSSDGLLYWAILAIDYGVRDYRESRERALRASQLETQLSDARRSEEHTSELQSRVDLVCRLLPEK